jgi:uncharacterized protein YndB with AHSA1/START domain
MNVTAEHTVTIERPPSEVFDYLTNVDNLPDWQGGVVDVRKETEGPVRVGTRFVETRRFLGRRLESTLEVTEHAPPQRFSLRVVQGPVQFEVRHVLEAADGGTRLNAVLEGDPGGFFKIAAPLVAMQGRRQMESDFGAMKTLLESRARAGA